MPTVKVQVFFGGVGIKKDEETLKKNCPHIVVGTPGRILALARQHSLNLKNVKHFVLDECDKMLEQLGNLDIFINQAKMRLRHDFCLIYLKMRTILRSLIY